MDAAPGRLTLTLAKKKSEIIKTSGPRPLSVLQRHFPDQRASGGAGGGQETETLSAGRGNPSPSARRTKRHTAHTHSSLLLLLRHHHAPAAQLQQCTSRLQFLESSTVGRSIVSKQEARVCDLENKLEFQRGQVKRFEVRGARHWPHRPYGAHVGSPQISFVSARPRLPRCWCCVCETAWFAWARSWSRAPRPRPGSERTPATTSSGCRT